MSSIKIIILKVLFTIFILLVMACYVFSQDGIALDEILKEGENNVILAPIDLRQDNYVETIPFEFFEEEQENKDDEKENLFLLPNLEASVFYDVCEKDILIGVSSRLAHWKFLNLRVGYSDNYNSLLICALSVNLVDLAKRVDIAWQKVLKTNSVGVWAGIRSNHFAFGVMAVLIKMEFR